MNGVTKRLLFLSLCMCIHTAHAYTAHKRIVVTLRFLCSFLFFSLMVFCAFSFISFLSLVQMKFDFAVRQIQKSCERWWLMYVVIIVDVCSCFCFCRFQFFSGYFFRYKKDINFALFNKKIGFVFNEFSFCFVLFWIDFWFCDTFYFTVVLMLFYYWCSILFLSAFSFRFHNCILFLVWIGFTCLFRWSFFSQLFVSISYRFQPNTTYNS